MSLGMMKYSKPVWDTGKGEYIYGEMNALLNILYPNFIYSEVLVFCSGIDFIRGLLTTRNPTNVLTIHFNGKIQLFSIIAY